MTPLSRGDVVYVVPHFRPDESDVERLAEQLATRVAARRRVLVITSDSAHGSGVADPYPPAMTVRRLRTFRVAQVPFMPRLAGELLSTPRESIIHVHVSQAYSPEVVWLVARLTRRPFVAHFHLDVEPSTRLGPLFRLYKRVVLARVLRAATRVVVLDRGQAQLVEDRYRVATKRISVIPHQVSAEYLALVRRPDLQMGPLRVLFVGQASGGDGAPPLLDVLGQVHSEVVLAIATSRHPTDSPGTDHPDPAEIEARLRLTGLEHVSVVGTGDTDAAREWYGWADLVVAMSDDESSSTALVGAMSAGVPVIAADTALTRSVLADAGLLVPPSAEDVAAAIDRLASEKDLRHALAGRSRSRASILQWDRLAEAMEDLYQAVAG